jgi:hypothetical protein
MKMSESILWKVTHKSYETSGILISRFQTVDQFVPACLRIATASILDWRRCKQAFKVMELGIPRAALTVSGARWPFFSIYTECDSRF